MVGCAFRFDAFGHVMPKVGGVRTVARTSTRCDSVIHSVVVECKGVSPFV